MYCIYCGMSNKQIASHYKIAVSTIKNRITKIMGKIGAKDRHYLASWWWVYAIDGNNEPTYKPDKRANTSITSERHRAKKRKAEGNGVTRKQWDDILGKYNNRCLRCGSTEKIQMDHVVSISNGGRHDVDNVQPLCQKCNCSKGKKNIDYRNT